MGNGVQAGAEGREHGLSKCKLMAFYQEKYFYEKLLTGRRHRGILNA